MKEILLIGRGTIAVNCLNILIKKKLRPRIIICDTKDSGKDNWTKSLFKRARQLGYKENINLFKESKVNRPEFISKIKTVAPNLDFIFSIQPRTIFKMPFINLARNYVVNLHFAPLPKLRGVAPCSWAFIDDLKNMGVTLHLIKDEGIDNGPIIGQGLFPIIDDDTSWTLFHKCIKEGTRLFKNNIDNILNNKVSAIPQNESEVSYHPYGQIDFNQSEVFNLIRSRIFPPYQLPFFRYKGKKVFILKVSKKNSKIAIKQAKIIFNKKKYFIFFPDGKIIINKFTYGL